MDDGTLQTNAQAAALKAVKGMNDILPNESALWQAFYRTAEYVLARHGFAYMQTPILEHTQVFVRGIGEVTDIVEKEMYTFTDHLNGDMLTLRPEGTAACIRAVNEHHLLHDGPKRVWYQGPMFRHERPQRGRYRQFHQLGIESLGFAKADADAELIMLTHALFKSLHILDGLVLHINNLGDAAHRRAHKEALIHYFNQHHAQLDEDSQRRLHTNPLRILDSKNPQLHELIEAAPRLADYIDGEAAAHFETLCQLLDALGIAYQRNHRLVRGLDYYNRTVFEWVSDELGAQGTLCGGGRYDPLMALMGGKDAPAVGCAMGIERILALYAAHFQAPQNIDAYLVYVGEAAQKAAFALARDLRALGAHIVMHIAPQEMQSLKAQMKKANQSGARFAMILGDDELSKGVISIKNLRHEHQQQTLPLSQVNAVYDHISASYI